jgi:Fis family transcriptional regulator
LPLAFRVGFQARLVRARCRNNLAGGASGVAGEKKQVATTRKTSHGARRTIARAKDSSVQVRNRPLRDFTGEALRTYLRDLNGHKPSDLYDLVMGEVEPPLFQVVLDYTRGNQSRAAAMLGLNRATLRKKLKQYDLLG